MSNIEVLSALILLGLALSAILGPVQGDLIVQFENYSLGNQAMVPVYETAEGVTAEGALEGFAPEEAVGLRVLDDVKFAVNSSYTLQVEDQFRARELFDQAMNLYRSGDYDRALEAVNGSTEAFENSTDSWTLKGVILEAVNESAGAVSSYDRALALDPSNVVAWNNRGVALFAIGQPEEALESLNAAIAIDPLNRAAVDNRLIILRALGREDEGAA